MNPDIPTNRKLLSTTLLVILSPLYATVLFSPYTGIVTTLSRQWFQGTPMAMPLLYLSLFGCTASLVWLLWRGTLVGPLLVLLVTMIGTGMSIGMAEDSKTYQLAIGAGRPMLGVDVYCNDVHLGKTPLTISEAEFYRRVKPWNEPPAQPLMIVKDEGRDNRYRSAKLFYVPQDIFELHDQWPPDHRRYSGHNDEEILEDLKTSKYWWHFEKDGCVGLTRLSNFGGNSGGGLIMTINADPSITFLSADAQLDLLLTQLEQDDYQPTQTWIDHFLKYKDLFFLEFHAKAKADERLQPALNSLVRAEFELSATPSESDCRRVVDQIVKRTLTSGCFTVPSLESLGIESVARAHAQPIVDKFLALSSLPLGGSNGRASSDLWTTYRRSNPRVQLLPVEHAIKKTAPAKLFDRLVYMTRKGQHMDLLGNYPREELVWLFSHKLRSLERQGGRRREWRINEALRMCTQVKNPLLEETIRQFVRENAGQGHGSAEHYVSEFVASRVNDPAMARSGMANWIFHWAPLEDRDKLNYLPRIQDPNANHYLRMLISRNDRRREDVIQQLNRHPNPALDEFIVDTYNWYESPRGPGHWSTSLTYALVKTDTPAIRELITGQWNKDDKTRSRMISRLKSGDWRQPNMNWLVPKIAELTARLDRVYAARLLSRIDTPEAYRVAEQWASDPDPDIASVSTTQLEIRDKRLAERQQQLAQATELITGKIKPDDLVTSAKAYTWNGEEYIPKRTAN